MIFYKFALVETKGKSLEEIESLVLGQKKTIMVPQESKDNIAGNL
jgi:hypothetical protein